MTTWNLTEKGTGITLSNNNLTAAGITQTSSVKSTDPKTSGKWFCEVKIDTVNYNYIGIAPSNASMTSSLSTSTDLFCYYYDGRKINSGVSAAYASSYTTGDIIGILVDFEDGILTFYKNGINQGVAYNNIKALADFCIVASSGTVSATGKVTANFGATPFAFNPLEETLPPGVKSYDGSQQLSAMNKSFIYNDNTYKAFTVGKNAIESVNIIPKMINDTTPAPYVSSASSSYGGYTAFNAFSQIFNGSSRWIAGAVAPQWAKIDLNKPNKAYSYKLSAGHVDQQTASWILQGSNDDNQWIDLHTVTKKPLAIDTYTEFPIPVPNYYRYYRVYITEVYSGGVLAQALASLSGFALMTEYIPASVSKWENISNVTPTKQQFIDKGMDNLNSLNRSVQNKSLPMLNNSEILLGEPGKVFSGTIDLEKYPDIKKVAINNYAKGTMTLKSKDHYSILTITKSRKVVNMTSNSTPSPFVASASGQSSATYAAWKAFDGSTTGSNIGWGVGVKSGWLQIDFGKKTSICGFTLHSGKNGGYYLHSSSPHDFKLTGSYDGLNWYDINEYVTTWGSNNASNTSKKFDCKYVNYRYYRLVINSSATTNIYVGEMFFEEYEIKMTEYPISNKNLLINNSGEIFFNYLIEKKDYVLQDDGSLGNFNTITTNQKPLSIKFD
ncbi:gp364 [Bacillus phage G]|uniref:Gp364 n=1 Tax=Bacillus phage G TaxID=2884420 RepID=G3MAA5_9CAUD|nr:gp364 [Bacillus phage G]AEO93623.1 gp364 [Bacillus phage G]